MQPLLSKRTCIVGTDTVYDKVLVYVQRVKTRLNIISWVGKLKKLNVQILLTQINMMHCFLYC